MSEVESNADMFCDWKAKVLHGEYPLQINDENIDKTGSLLFTKKGYLFPETEGFIISIQQKLIRTTNYERNILKLNTPDKCRRCCKPGETIEHVIAGCSVLADNDYLNRHNSVAKVIHSKLTNFWIFCHLIINILLRQFLSRVRPYYTGTGLYSQIGL